jgi:hypothetical protein
MKYLKSYKIFENIGHFEISIDNFLYRIGIPANKFQNICQWWGENRSNIKIHLFPFNTTKPIAGVFLGNDTICINERLPMPPHIKLFLALHESRHCDQQRQGRFMEGYYNTVVNGDKPGFLQAYTELERDANDFAVASMRQIGFEREMNMEEMRLRGNERAGEMVYNMMKTDILTLQATDFFDLLKKQIL